MTFGLQCDEPTSVAILDAAAEAGLTVLDTADVYPLGGGYETVGRTEEILGRWMDGRRDQFVVATKCVGAMGRQPWQRGASRRHILDAVDGSLRRLRTDFIDLYQVHQYDPTVTHDESLSALDHLVRVGKVRYLGCSNYLAYQLARAIGRSEASTASRMCLRELPASHGRGPVRPKHLVASTNSWRRPFIQRPTISSVRPLVSGPPPRG
jgi:aryl-alcohol dehydrogenase (NADP+)